MSLNIINNTAVTPPPPACDAIRQLFVVSSFPSPESKEWIDEQLPPFPALVTAAVLHRLLLRYGDFVKAFHSIQFETDWVFRLFYILFSTYYVPGVFRTKLIPQEN